MTRVRRRKKPAGQSPAAALQTFFKSAAISFRYLILSTTLWQTSTAECGGRSRRRLARFWGHDDSSSTCVLQPPVSLFQTATESSWDCRNPRHAERDGATFSCSFCLPPSPIGVKRKAASTFCSSATLAGRPDPKPGGVDRVPTGNDSSFRPTPAKAGGEPESRKLIQTWIPFPLARE